MIKFNVNLKFKDNLNQSVIFYIVRDGKPKLYNFFKKNNAVDPLEIDLNGQNSIFFAARDNRIDLLKTMINDGFSCEIIDKIHG